MNSLEEIALKVAKETDAVIDVGQGMGDAWVIENARRLVAALGAQEPVAWHYATSGSSSFLSYSGPEEGYLTGGQPLYAAPVLPSVPEGMILVKTVKCPNCDDVGWYVVPGRDGEPEQEQCEFCETVPNSIFNISKIARLSAAPSPQEDAP